MEHRFHLVAVSSNKKTGPIPVTTSSRSTCSDHCSFKGNGCYAEHGPLRIHWDRVPTKGVDLDTHCAQLKELPRHQLYRMFQAGDFPGTGGILDFAAMRKLVSANRGKHAIAYCHYDPEIPDNAEAVRYANANGLTINLSAETLEQADRYVALGIGPVVVVLPADGTNCKTPAGHDVLVCPASVNPRMNCARCAICAVPTRRSIVGFPAHGTAKRKVEAVFWAKQA